MDLWKPKDRSSEMLKSSNNVETNVYALEIAISAEDFDAAQNKAWENKAR